MSLLRTEQKLREDGQVKKKCHQKEIQNTFNNPKINKCFVTKLLFEYLKKLVPQFCFRQVQKRRAILNSILMKFNHHL